MFCKCRTSTCFRENRLQSVHILYRSRSFIFSRSEHSLASHKKLSQIAKDLNTRNGKKDSTMAKTFKKPDLNDPGTKPTAAKAAATKAKTAKKAKGSSKDDDGGAKKDWCNVILKAMVRPYQFGRNKTLTTVELAGKCDCHERCKGYLDALKDLARDGLLEKQSDASHLLTEKGAAVAGYVKKEFDASGKRTDEEWHAYIKSTLNQKWKGAQIFDLLLTKDPMSRQELAAAIGVHDRNHSFCYGLKELKEFGFVEKTSSGKCVLSTKAFIETPEKRPESKQEVADDSMDEDPKQEAATYLIEDKEGKDEEPEQEAAMDFTEEKEGKDEEPEQEAATDLTEDKEGKDEEPKQEDATDLTENKEDKKQEAFYDCVGEDEFNPYSLL